MCVYTGGRGFVIPRSSVPSFSSLSKGCHVCDDIHVHIKLEFCGKNLQFPNLGSYENCSLQDCNNCNIGHQFLLVSFSLLSYKWPCPDNQLSHLHLLVFLGRVTSSFVYQLFTSFFYLQYRNLKMNWKFSWYWPMGHKPIQFSYSLTVLNPSLDGVFSFIDSSCGTITVNHYITSVLPQ